MIRDSPAHHAERASAVRDAARPARRGISFRNSTSPPVDPAKQALGAENVREEIEGFPEVSEVEAIRHFTRLSTWNYAIDLGMYPLGSCTMKYNPRINETGGAHSRASRGRIRISPKRCRRAHGSDGGRWKTRSARLRAWMR